MSETLDVRKMSAEALRSLPYREGGCLSDAGYYTSLIVVPGRATDMHSSGYRKMAVVGCRWLRPVCVLTMCSDNLDFETDLPARALNVDCLPVSGALHFFLNAPSGHSRLFKPGSALSSFGISVVTVPAETARELVA